MVEWGIYVRIQCMNFDIGYESSFILNKRTNNSVRAYMKTTCLKQMK